MAFFQPICEFFPIAWSEKHSRSFLDESDESSKKLIEILRNSVGLYTFYNSEFEVIYFGKTKNNLWAEMKQTYMSQKSHYQRYRVSHPRGNYTQTRDGFVRKIKLQPLKISEAATYFSAYSVQRELIDEVETLLIRMVPNDLLNHKMEGNGTLKEYRE